MFEQDVAGLIKALRASRDGGNKVIEQALQETRKEIKSKDLEVKAAAVLKLVYLEMLGHSIAFAAFSITECMSSVKYHIKTIGYLAASQCFDRETEVAVLVVNLIKKDLLSPPTALFSSSPSSLTVAHLLSTLSSVSLLLTPTLARDLAPDLLSMLTHTRPQVRKQTVLVLWRIVRSWPEVTELSTGREERGEDPWMERLRERLGDDDMGVVSATVNLICELARKDPKTYLPLAPELFGLLTASTNNWMLIKIIKLFAVLTPHEPRLVRKLVPPLTELIETTPAMSLLYECIQTSIVGGMLNGRDGEALAKSCVDKLKGFLEDADQNLRYIALVALVKILPTHPHLVSTYHDTILACVDDADMSIRMRALDLVEGMVDRKSLRSIVERLMKHLVPNATTKSSSATAQLKAQQNGSAPIIATPLSSAYRSSLISLILRMCAAATYSNVSNFEWYIDTLVELAYLSLALPAETTVGAVSIGVKIRDQLIDVAARVRAIRPYAVESMARLLGDEAFLDTGDGVEIAQVLVAAAWICGEYCRELLDPRPVIAALFGSRITASLPQSVLAAYIHNGTKIYSSWLVTLESQWVESDLDQIRSVTEALQDRLAECSSAVDTEFQERAAELGQLLEFVKRGLDAPRPIAVRSMEEEETRGFRAEYNNEGEMEEGGEGFAATVPRLPPSCLSLLSPLFFSHELNPVNPKAQAMVSIPTGLNLDLVIVPRSSRKRSGVVLNEGIEEVDDFGRPKRVVVVSKLREEGKKGKSTSSSSSGKRIKSSKRQQVEEDPSELARMKADRLERQRDDPYYVGSSVAPPDEGADGGDIIPIAQLSLDHQLPTRRSRAPTPPPVHIDVDGEMPDGVEPEVEERVIVVVQEEKMKVETVATEGNVLKVVKKKKKDPSLVKIKKKKNVELES